MTINWPLVIVLVCLCIPGFLIAIPRLINQLLSDNSDPVKKRISTLAIAQSIFMVFIMSLAGTVLSKSTGLGAPILEPILKGHRIAISLSDSILPVFLIMAGGLVIFLMLYYGLFTRFLDKKNLEIMRGIRKTIGLDGCMLYAGVTDEILARWVLLNVLVFFGFIVVGHPSPTIIWIAIIISSILFTLGQLPAYIAAGCKPNRRFLYALVLLNGWQSIVFAFIFWHYGLLLAILAHMLFHLGWWIYDRG